MHNISHDTLLEAIWAVLEAPGADFGDAATKIDEHDTLSQLFDDLHQDLQRIRGAAETTTTNARRRPARIHDTTPVMQVAAGAPSKG